MRTRHRALHPIRLTLPALRWCRLCFLLCWLCGLGLAATARDLPQATPLWSAPDGPAQSAAASEWLEALRHDIANAAPACPPASMPALSSTISAQAFRLQADSLASGPAIVYLQDPVASTFVVVSKDRQGCPSIYVGGRWHPSAQREYLSPYPNTRLPQGSAGSDIQVVVQDGRVLRPWVQVSPEPEFRRDTLLIWMLLATLIAVLLMVILAMTGLLSSSRMVKPYVLYVAAFLWWNVQEFGMDAAWFADLFPPGIFVPLQCVSVALVILAIGWNMVEFLGLQGLTRMLIGGGQVLSAAVFVAAIWWPPGYRMGSLVLGINAGLTMVLLMRHVRHPDVPVRLFAAGFVATMIGGGMQSLSVAMPAFESHRYAVYAYALGGFVQVLFWLLAVTTRLRHERRQLIQGRSEELEQQVAQATAELVQRKQAAEEANRAKSDFLAAASHDLRQPSHAIGMLIARLGQFPMEADMRQVQRSLEMSAHAMQELLDELMDYSRLDASRQSIALRPVAMEPLLASLRDTLVPMATEKGLRLHIRPTRLCVWSDHVMLRRMVMNLAQNAIRYTAQGTVLIACRPTGNGRHVEIQCWDSGIGIAPQQHAQIFKEFFQIGNSARDRNHGMGLGLSIVQRSAQLLGHELTLRSEPGCGSRFSIMLPRSLVATPEPAPVDTSILDLNHFSGLKVLLIEDDEPSRDAMTGLLTSWGCEVQSAASGDMARACIRQQPRPALILSDYRLGGAENGISVVADLRSITGHPIPACLISGDMDATLLEEIKAQHMSLLNKPVRPAKLRSLIRHLVSTKN